MPEATNVLEFLTWHADVRVYRDRIDAERSADRQADKRGVQVVFNPFYVEDHDAWAVVSWKTPPKRAKKAR